MKILHVIGEMGYGGAELLAAEVGLRIASEGHDVDVLVIGFCEHLVLERLAAGGVRVIRLQARLSNPWSAVRIARIVSAGGYDVVHAHLFPALYWVAISRSLASSSARWFYTEHSTQNRRRRRAVLRPIERAMYSRFDRVVCISADVASALEGWVPGVSRIVISNGIDVERFRLARPLPRTVLGVSESARLIVMVGAFRPEKNHAILVEALARLPADFVVAFAGDGPERESVEQLALRLGVHGRVRFLGVFHEVERLLKAADVFVLSSFFEGFGLSAIEACAAGLPVVHSMVPGLSTVLDGVGWPIDPSDPIDIAQCITSVVSGGTEVDSKLARANMLADRYGLGSTVSSHLVLYAGGGV